MSMAVCVSPFFISSCFWQSLRRVFRLKLCHSRFSCSGHSGSQLALMQKTNFAAPFPRRYSQMWAAALAQQFAVDPRDAAAAAVFMRSCVDCGLRTGVWCDFCHAEERLPNEIWNSPQQGTPLCSSCDRAHGACHFCRGLAWCTPAPHDRTTADEDSDSS